MVTRRRGKPPWRVLARGGVASALIGSALGCNALLDNEPRVLAPSSAQGGEGGAEEPRDGGSGGEDAAGKGAGGASGESTTGGGEAGESAIGRGGAAGDAGSPSQGGESGSAPDDCSGEACTPFDTEAQTVNCACGGTKQQARTCGDACSWGAWTDTTACDVSCCTTVVYCDTQESTVASEFPGRGTWCRQMTSACSAAEAYADCLAAADTVCGGIAPSLWMEYL